ncbi:MAG: hypothetical protein K2J95_08215 [Lachnospiraceae bacterium]|nr:hypothetical protein [Lachnospiraceae bacterium]
MKKLVFIMVFIFLCGCTLQENHEEDYDGNYGIISENKPDNMVSENAAENVVSEDEIIPETVMTDDTEDMEDIFPKRYYAVLASQKSTWSLDERYGQYYEDLGGSWLSYYDSYMNVLDRDSEIIDFSAYATTRRNMLLQKYASLAEALRDPSLNAEMEAVRTAYGVDDETIGSYVDSYMQRADTCVYSFVRKCMIGELEQDKPYRDFYLKTCLYNGYFGYTFDSQTGERLALTDIVTDQEQLPELIMQSLEETYQETFPEGVESMITELLQDDALAWSLGYQGITFYIQSGQIGIDDIRIYQALILFAAEPDLFVEKYCDIPEYYAMQYDFMEGVVADTDNDGKAERIDMGNWDNVADKFDEWVWLNNNECLTLISGRNGDMFLYLTADGQLDYTGEAAIYDLSGEEPAYIYTESGLIERNRLIDPACVINRLYDEHMLIVGGGFADAYHISDISETGIPEESIHTYTWFYSRWNLLYQVENSIEGRIVNVDGEDQGESITLTEGMWVMAFRTDLHSYIDFILEDGRLCRLTVEEEDGICYYEGQSLSNYFDIMYTDSYLTYGQE